MKILVFVLALCYTSLVYTQVSGVKFEEVSWEEIKEIARTEDKLIFLDAYASWCIPCKQMDVQVFNRSDVGDYFNANFINYKMDLEKGIGPLLAARYGVSSYPALLFLTADETLVHQSNGYQNAPGLMSEAKTAILPEQIALALDERYAAGDRKPDFLRDYTYVKYKLMDDSHKPIIKEYIKTQKEFSSKESLKYIFAFTENFNSPLFKLFAKHRKDLYKIYDKAKVDRTLQIMVHTQIYDQPKALKMKEIRNIYDQAYPNTSDWMFFQHQSKQYLAQEKYEDYAKALIDYWEKYPSNDPNLLMAEAIKFDKWFEQKPYKKVAIQFVKDAISLDPEPSYYLTLSRLYEKTGEKKLAKKSKKKHKKLSRK